MGEEDHERLCRTVAEGVMGWAAKRIPWAYGDEVEVWHADDGVPVLTCHSWRPDADDRQCQQVLDRMVERGFEYTVNVTQAGAAATFRGRDRERTRQHASRRVACLQAALEAFE